MFPKSIADFFRQSIGTVPYLALFLGPLFFLLGVSHWNDESMFLVNSQKILATVLRVDSRKSKNGMVYRPVFEIMLADGSQKRYAGNLWTSPLLHFEGDTVPARYSVKSGEIKSIDLIASNKNFAVGFMSIGCIAGLGGVFYFWYRRLKRLASF
ncbi:MAG: hypothetical protein O3B08_06980 [Proteobacteria bacterium]|nr:hypothetical protein [Pseudomonadota bacterium]